MQEPLARFASAIGRGQRARASPRRLGERFRFCFVCLHPDAPSHALLTYAQLEPLIKVKRAQYQINLR